MSAKDNKNRSNNVLSKNSTINEITSVVNVLIKQISFYNKHFSKQEQIIENQQKIIQRVFGKGTNINETDITYGNLSDEVQRLSTVVAYFIYDNEQNYKNNSKGKRFDNAGYIKKIINRMTNLKKK